MPEPGYDVFISYSRPDAKAALELARSLRDAGFTVWLDIWELAVGASWQNSIEQAIRSASAMIICVGQSGASQWQREEYRTALQFEAMADRSKPLIPVLLPGADSTMLPVEFQERVWVDLRRGLDDQRELSRLIAALQTLNTSSEIDREERTGDILVNSGKSAIATEHFERALRIARATYGSKHPKIANLLTKLAMGKQRTGDLMSARALLEEALSITTSVSGHDSIELASASGINNLGSVLRDMGDVAAARALFERALAIDERALGPDHPDVAITRANLANILVLSGATDDALHLYREAYASLKRVYGSEHPLSRLVRSNLERAGAQSLRALRDSIAARGDDRLSLEELKALRDEGRR